MAVQTQVAGRKNFSAPDEVREFPKGKLEIVHIGNTSMGRATFEKDWKWSECVKPIAQTGSCMAPHVGYVISGRIKAVMDGGEAFECSAGDALSLPPGHDAWVVGNEPCVIVDFVGYEDYAKSK